MKWPGINSKTLWLLLVLAVAAIGVALLLFLPIRGSNLTEGMQGWTTAGCFAPGAVYPTTGFDRQINLHQRTGVIFWGSHCGNDASTGELTSPVFEAPTILELFLAGYAGGARPGLQLFLEKDDGQHQRVPLIVRRLAGESWVKLRWWTPASLRGQRIRLIAIDRESGVGGWLGVTNPRRLSVFNFCREQFQSWFRTIAIYLFQLALFLLPGYAAASILMARRGNPLAPIYSLMVVLTTGAVLGYLAFWAFFLSHGLGRFFSFAVYMSAAGLLLVPAVRPRAAMKIVVQQIREPLLYTTLAGLCYLSFYFLFTDPFAPGIGYASDRFFSELMAGDNVIPAIFADKIYNHKPVIPFCCGDWLSSDRPPLQTGIVMMERPFSRAADAELTYQLLSSALQCFWICGVWCLLTVIGARRDRIRQVLGFLIFSGFLFYNSVYTWPKLLAATYILFVFSILFDIALTKRRFTYFEAALAALCLGTALMSHPGSTFSLAVLVVLIVRLRSFFTLRHVAMAFLIVLVIYLPWSAYQKYVDPPGNRLLKMHLAGVMGVDSRTTLEAIRDAYQAHPWRELVFYKWTNLEFLRGRDFFDSYGLADLHGVQINHVAAEKSRNTQRVYMWNAAGLVNVGWLAAVYLLLSRPFVKRRQSPSVAIPYAGWLLAAALANFVFWSFITFGPYETQTAHSSYADILLASIGLLGFILALPRPFFILLLLWQVFNFFVVWASYVPVRINQPVVFQWPMMLCGALATLALLWMTLKKEKTIAAASLASNLE